MTLAKSTESSRLMLTPKERLIDFIIKSVLEGHYNLAKVLIDHDQNLISAFYKTESDFFRSNKELVNNSQASKKVKTDSPYIIYEETVYVRHAVNPDGNCGYTAFGIDREEAYQFLCNNIITIRDILKPLLIETLLLNKDFIQSLDDFPAVKRDAELFFESLHNDHIDCEMENLERHADNLNLISAYIDYDVRDKKIDDGWCHPLILFALAEIRGVHLRLFELNDNGEMIPHRRCPEHYPAGAENNAQLLFTNGNHFERLEWRPEWPANWVSSPTHQHKEDVVRKSQKLDPNIKPGLLSSLYHHELQRVLTENATKKQMYLCLLDLSKEFLGAIGRYAEEQFELPTAEFKAAIHTMFQQFVEGRTRKLKNTLFDLYKARIDADSEADVWFDNRCYSIRRDKQSYMLRFQGMAHFTEDLLELAQNVEDLKLIAQLIQDCKIRDEIILRQFPNEDIDLKSKEFEELNIVLLRLHFTYNKLKQFFESNKGEIFDYLTQDDGCGLVHHNNSIERRFNDLIEQYFPVYDFNLSYTDNVKIYNELSDEINQAHDDLLEYNTAVGMHLNTFEAMMCPLRDNERAQLIRCLGFNEEGFKMSDLGPRILPVNEVIDVHGNNLLHILLTSQKFDMRFMQFLMQNKIDIYFKNKRGKRPVEIVTENCAHLSKEVYKILMEYALAYIKPLCLDPVRSMQVNTAIVVIEQMFSDIEEYMNIKHLDDVKKIGGKKPWYRDTYEPWYKKTNDRAITLAKCFSFLHDELQGLPKDASMDIIQLKHFINGILDKIQYVLSRERSKLFRIMINALKIMNDPLSKIVDKQCGVIKKMEEKIDGLSKNFQESQRKDQQRHEEVLERQRISAEKMETLFTDKFRQQQELIAKMERQQQEFMSQIQRQQQEIMRGMAQNSQNQPPKDTPKASTTADSHSKGVDDSNGKSNANTNNKQGYPLRFYPKATPHSSPSEEQKKDEKKDKKNFDM